MSSWNDMLRDENLLRAIVGPFLCLAGLLLLMFRSKMVRKTSKRERNPARAKEASVIIIISGVWLIILGIVFFVLEVAGMSGA